MGQPPALDKLQTCGRLCCACDRRGVPGWQPYSTVSGSSTLTFCAPRVTVLQRTLGDADRSGGRAQGCKGL